MSDLKKIRREAASARFCRQCGECVGGLLAVLALKRCPACKAPIIPVEEHTQRGGK